MTTRSAIRDTPAYPLAEAARYIGISTGTLRTWVSGRSYPTKSGDRFFRPLIHLHGTASLLSFANLVEAHVLRALRVRHEVPLKAVRTAIAYAEKELDINRLLLHPDLRTTAGQVFLDKYGELINLSESGQLAMRMILEAHLRRIERDSTRAPARLFPLMRGVVADGPKVIAIDPSIAFGRPVVLRRGISTAAITARIDAGENKADVAQDYELTEAEVEEAVIYELAA